VNINEAFPHRAARFPDIPVREIVDQLTGNVVALCQHLLPQGRREGAEWRCGSTQGEPGKSLGVHLTGAKAGVWSDFAAGGGGDLLDLIQACLGLDKGEAVRWAKDWLGVGDSTVAPPQPQPRTQPIEPPRQDNPNRAYALDIWNKSQPAAGTPVEAYLRYRGIGIPVPKSIRYNPAVKYTQTGLFLPCMVAAIQVPDRSITAIHRTYIRGDGQGKAGVADEKMMLGSINGGAVRLAQVGPKNVVAEGLETSLSVQEATGLPTWSVLSSSNFLGLALPALPLAAEIVIAADNDENRAGMDAAEKAAALWVSQGRKVRIAQPPTVGTDFNDMAREELSARGVFAA
jgi:hypothetical protein